MANNARWRGRPVLGALLRFVVFAGPVLVGIVTSSVLAHVLVPPESTFLNICWWIGLFAVSTGALYGADRVFRRLIPLATLFKLTLLFPDGAPSRWRVALHARHTDELKRRIERQSRSTDDASGTSEKIVTLVAALNAHDRQTRGHSERTAVYTDLIAQELKLPGAARERLRWAALLHDVGKLTIDAETLNNPGRPEQADWEAIRQHPYEGAELAAPILGWLGDWGRAIVEHHERLDGAGYPEGLAGEEISMGARIVSVADAYDTMVSGRPYRKPLSPDAAREEIARGAGSAYDPKVCRALMSLSVGRSRRALGIFASLGQLPVSLGLDRFGNAVAAVAQTAGSVATAAVGAVALVASGVMPHPSAAADKPTPPPAPAETRVVTAPKPAATPKRTVSPTRAPSVVAAPVPGPAAKKVPAPLRIPVVTPRPIVCETLTLGATQDSFVVEGIIGKTHGGDASLSVQSKFRPELPGSSAKQDRRALVAFAAPVVSSGCAIESATLRLYATSSQGDRTIEAWRVTSAWNEDTVEWANQPSIAGPAALSPSGNGWRTWNVTGLLRAAAGSTHGFLLKDLVEGEKGFSQLYASSEAAENRPALVIKTVPR